MSDVPFEAPSIESIAEIFPAFDFDHLIAQGGMGAVYKARQRSLDRDVAVKILPCELGDDPLFRASFEAEAKAMARVVHPNLITVYDSGAVDGLLFLVMEYVPGKSLFHSAHKKTVDPQQAAELVIGICRGLAEAHEHSIVHRDVKPANILLTPKRVPKIGDFGLARAAGHHSGGIAMGTPGYTAPEVIDLPELADQRSDIFSVGVILRELITGRPPEDDPNPDEGIADSKLLGICKKATDPDPSKRFQDGESMVAALKSWVRPEAKPSSSSPPGSAAARRAVVDNSASSTLGRNLAIIIVLLAAISVAWKLLQEKKAANKALANVPAESKIVHPGPKQEKPLPAPRVKSTKPVGPSNASPPPVTKASSETPAQSLIRLRNDLAEGNFAELPVGTLTKGSSYYFYVSKATTWQEASRMARTFGGHLPLVEDDSSRQWLAESIPEEAAEDTAWIGATRTSPDLWQLVSASLWKLDLPPQGSGEFAAIQRDGSVQANGSSDSHPFFIQWHRDDSNPIRIEMILKRCKESQETNQPFFPPGIETQGERKFLVVEQSINATDAREMAQLGGGELMTAATEEEADWIEKRITDVAAPDGLWLGATLQDDLWVWNSNQAWTFARWAPDSKLGSGEYLLIRPDSGWVGQNQEHQASGFIIEWSDDRNSEEPPLVDNGLKELGGKVKELVAGLDAKRRKAAAKNADKFIWKLDVWLKRRSNNTEITQWTPYVLAIKATVKDGRLPVDIPRNPTSLYRKPLHEIAQFQLNKQVAIDLEFETEAKKIRHAYHDRLRGAAKAAEEIGQRDKARKILGEIEAAADFSEE